MNTTITSSPFDDDNDDQALGDTTGEVVEITNARRRRRRDDLRDNDTPPGVPAEKWEVVLDDETADEDGTGTVVVDPPDPPPVVRDGTSVRPALAARSADRRPIVAPWLRDRSELRYATRWAAGHVGHSAAYHAVRTPKYAGRAAYRAPIGAAKLAGHAVRWAADAEGRPLRAAAVRTEDADQYLKLSRQRLARMRWRLILLGIIAAAAIGGAVAVKTMTPGWAHWLSVVVIVAVLAYLGSAPDRPLLDVPAVVPRVRKLSADIVQRAVVSTGLAKEPEEVVFPAPIVRDGPGWRAVVDLPHGVTVGQVVDRRDRLASGLDLALGQVWPEGVPGGSLRRLVLWVGDEDLSQTKPPAWPLRERGAVDLFGEFPFGTDQRGNPVLMCLMFTALLVGAIPRMGKTFAARLAVLAAALDPTVELHVYDFKGGQDWMPFAPIAHRLGIGDEPDTMAAVLTDMRGLKEEMSRRYRVLRGLPSDVCPEGKVTRELANKKTLKLHPIVVSIDECQVGFIHAVIGGEFAELVTDLIKRGPAVGIILVLATQKPDKDSLPSGVRDNVGTRFGMRVMTWQVSDMVLGSGMSKAGFNAAALARADRGIGYLVGASDDVEAQLARSYFVDTAGAALVIERARAAREAAGTITGQAAGEAVDTAPSYSLLDDVAAVLAETEPKVWSDVVIARLAELRPDAYTGWTPAQLTAGLKPYGVATGQVWGQPEDGGRGRNKRGVVRDDVLAAIDDRNRKAIE